MDSNVRVEDNVEIDKDLCIEEEDLNVTNFIPQTIEQFALSDDDENDFPVNEDDACKIKDFSEALRYSEELKKVFLCKGGSEGLAEEWQPNVHLQAFADVFIFVISEPTGEKLKPCSTKHKQPSRNSNTELTTSTQGINRKIHHLPNQQTGQWSQSKMK
ncbi:hypothetical protein AVEN_193348-1 [Araneus ventricosus]|uniref:Uncharacterized protein n=1 Tax=Araneus ventricosus TaxID=182803 RepID=A0A4Y2ESR8_ARAVE|nr:hypothetical protein AVEN_193348-1 [Araneus ventricosus]